MRVKQTAVFVKRVIFKTVEHPINNNLQNCVKLAIKCISWKN